MDSVVNTLIILFIVVFDPLAITLVLAYNFMKEKNEQLDTTIDIIDTEEDTSSYTIPESNDAPDVVTQRIEPEEVEEKFNEITTANEDEQPIVNSDQSSLIEPVTEQEKPIKPIRKSIDKKSSSKVIVDSMDYMSPEPVVEDTIISIDEVRAQKAEKARQLYSGGISSS